MQMFIFPFQSLYGFLSLVICSPLIRGEGLVKGEGGKEEDIYIYIYISIISISISIIYIYLHPSVHLFVYIVGTCTHTPCKKYWPETGLVAQVMKCYVEIEQ